MSSGVVLLGKKVWSHKDRRASLGSGRWWLHWGRTVFNIEWYLGRGAKHCHALVKLPSEEPSFGICLGIPWLFDFYFSFDSPKVGFRWPKRGRHIGVRVFAHKIWLSLWDDPMAHNHNDPWWWSITISPLDILLGKTSSEKTFVKGYTVEIPMPEDIYTAAVNVYEYTYRRPRWPFPKKRLVSHVDLSPPIPVPGKGTCSYNIGEDAVYSLGTAKQRPYEVVGAVVQSVMRDRLKYGGPRWRPECVIEDVSR